MTAINQTIGRVKCPFTGCMAEVRKNKKGKLYYYSDAGMITPNLEAGQEWLLNHAEMFKPKEVEDVNGSEPVMGRRFRVNENLQAEQQEKEDSGWTLI